MDLARQVSDLDLPVAREGLEHCDAAPVESDLGDLGVATVPRRQALGHDLDRARGQIHGLDAPLLHGLLDVRTGVSGFEPNQLAAGELRIDYRHAQRRALLGLVDNPDRLGREVPVPEITIVLVVTILLLIYRSPVLPFVPLGDTTMAECVELAQRLETIRARLRAGREEKTK